MRFLILLIFQIILFFIPERTVNLSMPILLFLLQLEKKKSFSGTIHFLPHTWMQSSLRAVFNRTHAGSLASLSCSVRSNSFSPEFKCAFSPPLIQSKDDPKGDVSSNLQICGAISLLSFSYCQLAISSFCCFSPHGS